MGKIARSTSIPIATGERLVTIHDFQKLFEEGACAIAQPDLGSCGGITACKKIAGEYGGKVPESMEELIGLPGVARKTANIVLSSAFILSVAAIS